MQMQPQLTTKTKHAGFAFLEPFKYKLRFSCWSLADYATLWSGVENSCCLAFAASLATIKSLVCAAGNNWINLTYGLSSATEGIVPSLLMPFRNLHFTCGLSFFRAGLFHTLSLHAILSLMWCHLVYGSLEQHI